MTAPLAILLGGRRLGTVGAGGTHFAYDSDYLAHGTAAVPLSLSMPLSQHRHPGRTIRRWLEGLLPDNVELLRHWQRVTGAASSSPFDLLATPMGLDCAGAVQICPTDDVDAVLSRGGSFTPLTESDVTQRLRAVRQQAHLAQAIAAPGYFSLAGAQAKIALHRHQGAWHQPHGTAATTHILKPTVFFTQHQAVIEHLSMAAARRLGLPAASTEAAVFGGFDTVVVERFDRRRVGDRLLRLHQEDVCQALGLAPALRYEQHGGPSPTDIVALLRRHSSAPADDITDLLDAWAYCWVIASPDGHAKNLSLLLDGGEVRLAPMYDVCSVLPYLESGEAFTHAFSIGGSHVVAPDDAVSRWTRFASDIGIAAEALFARICDIAAAVPDAVAAEAAGLPGELAASARVALLLERLEARTSACLARMS